MITLTQLLRLQDPILWKGGRLMFPKDIAFLVQPSQFAVSPDNEVIFNPFSLGDLLSGNCEYEAAPGETKLALSPMLRVFMDANVSSMTIDMPKLSLMSNLTSDPSAPDKWRKAIVDLINTTPDLSALAVTSITEQAQLNVLHRLGAVMNVDFLPTDDFNNSSPYIITSVKLSATGEYPFAHPVENQPASLALTPELASGAGLLAKFNLAAALSPIAYILASSGQLVELPLFLISSIRYEQPKPFATPAESTDARPGPISIIYQVSPEWASLPLIHVSHSREVSKAIFLDEPYLPYVGGNVRWSKRDLPITSISLDLTKQGTANPDLVRAMTRMDLLRMSKGMSGSPAQELSNYYHAVGEPV